MEVWQKWLLILPLTAQNLLEIGVVLTCSYQMVLPRSVLFGLLLGSAHRVKWKWVKFALNWMETYYHVWKGGIYISKLCEAPSRSLMNFVVSAYRKNALYLSVNVLGTKVLIRDTIFTSLTGDGVVCYTAVFRVVTQCSSPLGRSVAWRH